MDFCGMEVKNKFCGVEIKGKIVGIFTDTFQDPEVHNLQRKMLTEGEAENVEIFNSRLPKILKKTKDNPRWLSTRETLAKLQVTFDFNDNKLSVRPLKQKTA